MLLARFRWLVLLAMVYSPIADGWRRRRRRRAPPPPDTTPPTFSNCPQPWTVTVTTTSAVVTWSEPTATDNKPTGHRPVSGCYGPPGPPNQPGYCPYIPVYDVTPRYDASDISNCPQPWTITVTANSAVVTWTEPTATDNKPTDRRPAISGCLGPPGPPNQPGYCPYIYSYDVTPSRTSGPASGSRFNEGSHSITYTARDSAGQTATCVISFTVVTIRCPSIGSSSQRSVSCTNSYVANSRCTFRCTTAYYVSGSSTVTCSTSGSWSGSFPTCRIRTCSPPATPSYGTRSCPHYNYGSVCTFDCNSGYTLSGSSTRVCGSGGAWSGSTTSCRDTQPPTFTNCPSNIVVTNDDRATSTRVSYPTPSASDNSGSAPTVAKRSGPNSGSILSAGAHAIEFRATDASGNHADCRFSVTVNVISCPNVPTQAGRIAVCPHSTLKGATCTFSCAVGYRLSGPTTTTCNNGDWNRGFPNCNSVTCPQLSAPQSGTMGSCGNSYGSTCTFGCNTGHDLVGSSSRQCSHQIGESTGFWGGSPVTCRIRTCQIPAISGGLISVSRSTCQHNSDGTVNYGRVCQYGCSAGFHLTGNNLRTCGATGDWVNALPVCNAITCPLADLPAPANGARTRCTGTTVGYGDTCVLSCNRGYRPESPVERTCQDGGQGHGVWSASTIACSMITCSPLSPPSHGRVVSCSRSGSSVAVSQQQGFDGSCTVECNSGYTLTSGAPTRICLVTGQWDGQSTVCTDETPPVLDCPDDRTVYAEPNQVTASPSWSWEPLRASDASGQYTAVLVSVDSQSVSGRPASLTEGSHTLVYTATDSSGNSATCSFGINVRVVRCPVIDYADHTTVSGCSTTGQSIRGAVCRAQCDVGYERTLGDAARTCTVDSSEPAQGFWSGTQLQCSAVQCSLPSVSHGSISGCTDGEVSFQESCQFACEVGYRTPAGISQRTRTCQADRTFSGQDFDCTVQVTCPALPAIFRGGYTTAPCSGGTPLPYSTTCEVVCESGYNLAGPLSVNCLGSGSWSDTRAPSCIDVEDPVFDVSCPVSWIEVADRGVLTWTGTISAPSATDNSGEPAVQRVDGSAVSSQAYPEGLTAISFEATDPSGNAAQCTISLDVKVKRCSHLAPPQGGAVQPCTNHYGSTCDITCNTGHQLSGSSSRRCELDDGGSPYWSGTDTVCTIRTCPVVEPPINALPSNCGGTPGNLATFGSICSFYCPHGYTPQGQSTVNCQADGTWSEASFECEAITCSPLNIDGVNVSPSDCLASPRYGQQCIFSCPLVGYSVQPISSIQVTCTGGGFWSGNIDELRCEDATLPEFTACPGQLTFYTDPATQTALTDWIVTATDNDGSSPSIFCDPPAGTGLNAGDYIVTCTATDGAGNSRRCNFDVKVKERRCSSLYPPVFGSFVGSCSRREGSMCTVTCEEGYRLVGSSEAVCETVDGATVWTMEEEPQCDVITCNALEEFDSHGKVEPFYCRSPNEPYYGSQCDVVCTDQYTLDATPSSTPNTIECLSSGLWSNDIAGTYACADKLPPSIIFCPPPIQVTRSDVTKPVTVYFDIPLATDNSKEVLQPMLSPSVSSPHDLTQDTTISCLFADSAGNENNACSIDVTVIDNVEPVIVEPCPDNIEVTLRSNQIELTWEEPRFMDPGGKHIIVLSNYSPGNKFTAGEYFVKYTGINQMTGRQSECEFKITVDIETCPALEAPANGVLACHESADGQVCVLTCQSGFSRPPNRPQGTFLCLLSGKWSPHGSADCGSRSRPRRSTIPVTKSYATDNCDKAGSSPAIATAFLQDLLATQFADICGGSTGCSVEDIRVTCGPVSSNGGRRRGGSRRGRRSPDLRVKRQAEEEEGGDLAYFFEVDLGLDVDPSLEVSDEGAVQNANSTLRDYATELENFLPGVVEFPEDVGGSISEIPGGVVVDDVVLTCSSGAVPNVDNSECVACVPGTYFAAEEDACLECPLGTYQNEEKQSACKPCPSGTSTDGTGAKSLDECYDLCPRGSSSRDGLFGCAKCAVGTYQPLAGQTACLNCTEGLTTPYTGATDVSACAEPCPAGSYSITGLGPCAPCSQRYYQPEAGQRYCLICEGRKTTSAEGSTSESQCIEMDQCSSAPCLNNGDCVSLIRGYFCRCAQGFEGLNCEIDIDECEYSPCRNDGTCTDRPGSYVCSCPDGFSGPDCSLNINECIAEPCLNGGKCRDRLGGFTCYCPPQYEGDLCETERDPCDTIPCLSGGTCEREGQEYSCTCPPGFTGDNCEVVVRACGRRPCVNGDCVDLDGGGFRCECYKGYEGELCDSSIDYCHRLDCENDGTCVPTREGATCICPFEFAGETCDHTRTICDDEKCLNGAVCNLVELLGQKNEYSCDCLLGFTGRHCETNIDECASMPCSSQATCEDLINDYNCQCLDGYEGIHCEIETDECITRPCAEGSTCIDEVAGYLCLCQPGKTGPECEEDIDYCLSSNCTNGATCINHPLGYTCSCPPGYSGVSCEINIDECLPNPCHNQASCIDGVASFTCVCASGYTGDTCESEIDECENHECQNGATCMDLIGVYVCECVYGYEGQFCDDVTDFCVSSPCADGSTCEPFVAGYRCLCQMGYTGERCDEDIDECSDSPCLNNATCINGVAEYRCICRDGYTGGDCETELDECLGGPCRNGGVCIDMVNAYDCQCLEGFSGSNCELNIDDCVEHQCLNNASCIDGVANHSCLCSQDWTGQYCEDFIPCQGNPCLNGGVCFENQGLRFCSCPVGFHGELCEGNTDECLGVTCQNGGECVDLVNDYFCSCTIGYTGNHCEVNPNDCGETSCRNGGTCIDGLDSFDCICPAGISGDLCEEVVNPCLADPCQNGGSCFQVASFSVCACQTGFEGQRCETDINECHSSPCLNSGYCIDQPNGFNCVCLSAYVGDRCQIALPGDADLKFHSSRSEDLLKLENVFDHLDLPHIKINYWFTSNGNANDFILFEYTRRNATQPDLIISNITQLTVKIYGRTIFQLANRDLSDNKWHNLVVTLIAKVGFEVAVDGVLLENRTLPAIMDNFKLGGDVRLGYNRSGSDASSEVVVSSVHMWSYDRGEVFIPCKPQEPGDILSWQQILAMSQMGAGAQQRTVLAPSTCDDVDGCWLRPCHAGATCLDQSDGFTCLCPPGFSGERCDQEIDHCENHHCQNGAYCISGNLNFSCLCSEDHTGGLCEIPVVHGGWSPWSLWGDCTSSCDGGRQSKTRTCTNPSPANGGRPCTGPLTQVRQCNIDACPSCSPMSAPWNGALQCRPVDGNRECTMSCASGYSPSFPLPEYYVCGPETNYAWLDSVSGGSFSLPTCVARVRRSAVTAAVQIKLPGLTCQSTHDQDQVQAKIENQLEQWREDIPCLEEGWCDISGVEVSDCSPVTSYGKFIAKEPSTPLVTFYMVQTNPDHNKTIDVGGDEDTGLRDSINIIRRLVTTHGIDLGAHKMTMDNSTIYVDGWDVCPPGTIESNQHGFCYPCLPGTYRTSSESSQGHYDCEPCPLDSYQPEQSSESCIPCPEGLKTAQTGSMSQNDCLEGVQNDVFFSTGAGGSDPWEHAIPLLIGLSAMATMIFVIYSARKARTMSRKVDVIH